MTGHAAFARTLRALDADSFRVSKLALLVAVILLAAWTWWFFTPSIISTKPETVSLSWVAIGRHAAIINPSPDVFGRIRNAQSVRLHFLDRTVDAQVTGFSLFKAGGDRLFVDLEFTETIPSPLPTRAVIEIEASRVSPATFALRALTE